MPNLLRAARTASRGKRYRRSAAAFLLRMEQQCLRLSEALAEGSWRPSPYRVFRITDPKPRTICAAPFADRVVHQAMVQVVEPAFERGFIYDSYSCRVGKGTHAALRRVAAWVREYPWVLKVDVQKYFPSIDHRVVMALLRRRIRCERTLSLFEQVLSSWHSDEAPLRWFDGDGVDSPLQRRRGLPIGNLTSQFLSNVVLDAVDHRVKDGLGVRAYARYCDDMVVFGRVPAELRRVQAAIAEGLRRLRLSPHPLKTRVAPCSQGLRWVGFQVLPSGVRFADDSLRRLRRRVLALRRARPTTRASVIAGLLGHARHGMGDQAWRGMVSMAEGALRVGGSPCA
ncbi:MAG: group II intron reverse transcriptase domain-containing protein [Planctomycetes bacterium]|nr:group II intron reverse transcriptase domain-containing protein [Planctomycetota bacterium]